MLVHGYATNQMCFESKPQLHNELRTMIVGHIGKIHDWLTEADLSSVERDTLIDAYKVLRDGMEETIVYDYHTINEQYHAWQALRSCLGRVKQRLNNALSRSQWKTCLPADKLSDTFTSFIKEFYAGLEQPLNHKRKFKVHEGVYNG